MKRQLIIPGSRRQRLLGNRPVAVTRVYLGQDKLFATRQTERGIQRNFERAGERILVHQAKKTPIALVPNSRRSGVTWDLRTPSPSTWTRSPSNVTDSPPA
jgi:hypothetical protein